MSFIDCRSEHVPIMITESFSLVEYSVSSISHLKPVALVLLFVSITLLPLHTLVLLVVNDAVGCAAAIVIARKAKKKRMVQVV